MGGKHKNSLSSRVLSAIPRSRRKSNSSVPKSPRSCRNIVDYPPKSPNSKSPQSCRNFVCPPKSPKSPKSSVSFRNFDSSYKSTKSPNSSRSLVSSGSSLSSGKQPKSPRSSRSLLSSARLIVGKKGKDNEIVHLENDIESLQEIIPVIEEEEESEEESEFKKAKKKMVAPETSRADKSSSKSKKKKDKIKEIMLDDGTKKRKKSKRRASMGNTSNYSPPSPVTFGSSGEGEHSSSFADGESSKMMSTRTALTERSSSHHSMSSERIEAFKLETPQKTKKKSQKNIQEIHGQLWRCDEKGNPISKVRKKASKSGDNDRLSLTDHGTPTTISETPTKRKNKKGALSRGYKSVRHISSTGKNGYNSSSSEEKMNDTVLTTGTKSLDNRPNPRRHKSQGDMGSLMEDESSSFQRKKPQRTSSGDLDMLMSQSVHDHTRKVPSTGKPKLQRKGSTMGKLLKLAGKSTKILPGKKPSKNKGLVTSRSNPELSGLLPDDVKEIDGVLWKVDEYGNKMNKVKHSSTSIGCSSDEEDDSDFDSDNDSQNMYDIGWSGKLENVGGRKSISDGASVSGGSVSGRSTSNHGGPERKGRRQERRGSMENKGPSSSHDRSVSVSSRRRARSRSNDKARDDSTKSLYTNEAPKKPDRHRSRSHDRDEPKRSRSKSKGGGDNHNLVQNLQHRLRASEKEVASLCRTSMQQQEEMSELTTDLRKAQAKLKTANSYKFALTAEVDKLNHEIEIKSMLEKKNEQPKVETNNSGNDRMVAQVRELKQDKQCLQMNLEDEKARGQARLEVKDDEIRFLQEELERMRSQQGDQYLNYMQKVPRCPSSDDESLNSSKRGKSMQFVGKILGNHNNVQAQTDLALKKQEIRDLQDRVNNLQTSNEKLKKELKDATLTIKDDDDEEIRKAKEAAAKASLAASQHRPTRRRLSIGAMSLY